MNHVLDQDKENLLMRIARHLMLYSSSLRDLGLYHGKMGLVLFFAHYAKYTRNTIYDDFAYELLDDINNGLHEYLPVNFEFGLSGIGWGIEYLIQHKFMEGDSTELLSEVDDKIMEWNVQRVKDTSLRTGLAGIFCYVDKRIKSPSGSKSRPFDDLYLTDWDKIRGTVRTWEDKELLLHIAGVLPEGDSFIEWRLGIENGCAGYGLNNLLR